MTSVGFLQQFYFPLLLVGFQRSTHCVLEIYHVEFYKSPFEIECFLPSTHTIKFCETEESKGYM